MSIKYRWIILIIITTLEILSSGQEWPILLFEEGDSGVIPCIPRGQATTFFWTRGEWYNISNEVAYNVNGVSGPDSEKFYVFSNGSLLLKNMTAMDEGNYYCRIASDRTQCHGSVTLYLKAANADKLPFIDRCSTEKGCTIYEKPSSRTFLTCKANQVSSDMSLKWFIESKQITDGVEERQDKNAMNETVISSTINIKYTEPQFLTCQASSMKMETAFAHVQLQSEPVHRTSAGIIVVTVILGATCTVLLGFVLYAFVKHNQNKKKKLEGKKKQPDTEKDEGESKSTLLHNNKQFDEVTGELEQVKKELSSERQQAQQNEANLKKLNEELLAEKRLTQEVEKKLSAESAKLSVEEKNKKELKEQLQRKETELRENLERQQLIQKAINDQEKGEGKKLNETIDTFMRKTEEKDQKLQDAEVNLQSMNEKLQLSNQELQTANHAVTSLKSQLQAKDNELESHIKKLKSMDQELTSTKDTLQKTQDTLKVKDATIRERDKQLKFSEGNLKEAEIEVKNLSRSQELFQRQLRLNVLEGKDNFTTLCRIKMAKRKKEAFIFRKDEVVLKTTGSEYKYSFIFPDHATREHIYSRLEDLVQNAIDGGKSAILLHGNCPEHNLYVMYGSGNEIDEGIVLKTIRKIFHVSKTWTKIGYEAEINTSFAKIFPEREFQFVFSSVDGPAKENTKYLFSNDDLEVKGVKVPVPTEEMAISFLKKFNEKQARLDEKQVFTNDFVQFFITTKLKSNEISTGTLTFVLYNDAEALKDCFTNDRGTSLFPRYFSSMINAEGSKVRILANIDEDKKEEAKDHLKFSNWILKEKSSFLKKIIGLAN